jgi:hypothetical protein
LSDLGFKSWRRLLIRHGNRFAGGCSCFGSICCFDFSDIRSHGRFFYCSICGFRRFDLRAAVHAKLCAVRQLVSTILTKHILLPP